MKSLLFNLVILTSCFAFSAEKKYTINWILAHEPARVFLRAANEFKGLIEERSKGEIEVNIITQSQYSKSKYPDPLTAFNLVANGELQMSQIYTTYLGKYNSKFWILDLPFLFENHQHATQVLDGAIGGKILAGLDTSAVKGLAFTYSGGFRIVPTSKAPLNTAAAFKGMKIGVTQYGPVAKAYLKELGAIPVQTADAVINSSGSADGFETTYARLDGIGDVKMKYLNETHHTLFLTSIVINSKFLNSLPAKYQDLILATTKDVAVTERLESIKDGESVKNKFVTDKNLKVVLMPAEETEKMKAASQVIYKKYAKMYGKELVEEIKLASQAK